jgi:hypothetical protein
MAVFLAWIADPDAATAARSQPGPWTEIREAAPGLLLVESDESLSRVYHEVKWLLPDGCALTVAPLPLRPKSRGLAPGTVTWLRDRLPGQEAGERGRDPSPVVEVRAQRASKPPRGI